MKKQMAKCLFLAVFITLIFFNRYHALDAQSNCNSVPACKESAEKRPLPEMYVNGKIEDRRRIYFENMYKKFWGFTKAEDVSVTYKLVGLQKMFQFFEATYKLDKGDKYDSVNVYFAACGEKEYTNRPGIKITKGADTYKLLLLFRPVKDKAKKPNYYVMDTTVSDGYTEITDSLSVLLENYYTNPTLNVDFDLNPKDYFNHVSWNIHNQDMTNTLNVSYRYTFLEDYFLEEPVYQSIKNCADRTTLNGVMVYITCYDDRGDELRQNPKLSEERVERLNTFFKFLKADGSPFDIEHTDDYECRSGWSEQFMPVAVEISDFINANRVSFIGKNKSGNFDTLSKLVANLNELLPTRNFYMQKISQALKNIKKNKKTVENLNEINLDLDELKKTPGGGTGTGDNGQANP